MPSGPKKRKAAKKRKELLGIQLEGDSSATTSPPPGNGSESGRELTSPISLEAGALGGEERKMMEKEGNASENSGPVVPDKAEDYADGSADKELKLEGDTSDSSETSSASSVEAPVSKAEVLAVEIVESTEEPQYGDSISVPEVTEVLKEEERKKTVDVIEAVAHVEKLASPPEEAISVQSDTIPVEAVETSSLVEPPPGEKEGKDLSVSVAPTEQPPQSSEQLLHTESREIGNEAQGAVATQVARRTSWWLSCCGLLDAFGGSNR